MQKSKTINRYILINNGRLPTHFKHLLYINIIYIAKDSVYLLNTSQVTIQHKKDAF